jgi:hypothetical protein
MTTTNVQDLKDFIATRKVGDRLEIATSEYASNTTPAGHSFDFHSTAPAVRSLIKAGYLEGANGWRYYDVRVARLPIPSAFADMHEVILAWRRANGPGEKKAVAEAFRDYVQNDASTGDLYELLKAISARGYVSA